jgi:hypothetical protein
MKYILISLLIILSQHVTAQEGQCYSIVVKGASICNSKYKWNTMKVTASKEKLLNFLRSNQMLHSCNYLLKSEDDIFKEFKKADCSPELIKIEFEKSKDILQLYEELKENKNKEKKTFNQSHNDAKDAKAGENKSSQNAGNESEEPPSAEICISSNGEISLSFGNEMGSFQVTSKGKFSLSVKGEKDTEYKVGL